MGYYEGLNTGALWSCGQALLQWLKKVVREAWDSVTPKQLDELIESMQARCQAVIEADGKYTEY
jgi:hypothetical protein